MRQKHPGTEAIFERHGVRPACYDCTIEEAARRTGDALNDLLRELNELIVRKSQPSV